LAFLLISISGVNHCPNRQTFLFQKKSQDEGDGPAEIVMMLPGLIQHDLPDSKAVCWVTMQLLRPVLQSSCSV
jgi:hypothetical protein